MVATLGMRLTDAAQGAQQPGSVTNFTFNSSALVCAWIVQAESTEAITHVWFRYGARTGTPPTYLIRIEPLGTDGNPTGSDIGSTQATFTPPADTSWNGTGRWIALGSSYTPTRGQFFAIVIRHSSGTIDGSNNSSFSTQLSNADANTRLFPFNQTFSGSWTKNATTPIYGMKGASSVFGRPILAALNASVTTSGHRACAAFTIPSSIASAYVVDGFEGMIDIGSNASTVVIGIWNAAGTAIHTDTIDTDNFQGVFQRSMRYYFSSAVTLVGGTKYYIGLQATGFNVLLGAAQLTEANDRKAFPNGENMCVATWNGSAWTEDTTAFPQLYLISSDITLPSGGSVFLPRPMNGGYSA
jgi:hypothetical protein